ncbi:MAG: CinA family protein [Chloroflexi bacterium]|uniref:CinA family protein n=1 Tax=Candidatus Chlorohelix allophototropha TaxID=3003348 RepID=A0A8T7M0N8_9CHLR|nr:CinA family protein [Chloroflexota bacterium]WJW67313.1 nicotinamide-nucleotide amidohydrolase family protein [Chloroflexota bacterium L227-S17]
MADIGSILVEGVVGVLLREKRLTVATAESCTGGLIGDRITNIAGSSDYFMGGVMSYSNGVKEKILGVPMSVLETMGAVSSECALAMAQGVRRLLNTDIGVSATGIAGPGGGTPQKPVGLVYIALSADGYERVERFIWSGDRIQNKRESSEAALKILLEYLQSL